eukprot:sb/3465614/
MMVFCGCLCQTPIYRDDRRSGERGLLVSRGSGKLRPGKSGSDFSSSILKKENLLTDRNRGNMIIRGEGGGGFATKSGWPLSRGQIQLISYIGGNLSCHYVGVPLNWGPTVYSRIMHDLSGCSGTETSMADLVAQEFERRSTGSVRLTSDQEKCIEKAIDGNNILVTLPTGYGKSLIFIGVSLHLEMHNVTSITLVVVPTVAIMEDHKASLERFQIPCLTMHSITEESMLSMPVGHVTVLGFPEQITSKLGRKFIEVLYYVLKRKKGITKRGRENWREISLVWSRDKSEDTKVISALALVGVAFLSIPYSFSLELCDFASSCLALVIRNTYESRRHNDESRHHIDGSRRHTDGSRLHTDDRVKIYMKSDGFDGILSTLRCCTTL